MRIHTQARMIGTVKEVEVEFMPGFLLRFIGGMRHTKIFRGDGILWYNLTGGRASLAEETLCVSVWEAKEADDKLKETLKNFTAR